jgi:hypothetical protein
MLLTFLTAFPMLADVIRKNKRHIDYERVTALAALYRQLITGEDSESLLKPFVRREDDEMFAQRVAITSLLTEAWADTLMNPFFRIGRLDNIRKLIGFDASVPNADIRVQEIEDRLLSFYGTEPLEGYLGSRFIELNFTDPNTFIAVDFDSFDNLYEKARPYPVEYTAEEAIDFKYKNNILQYLIVKKAIPLDGTWGEQYLMYLPNEIIRLTQVKPTNQVVGENLDNQIIDGYWQYATDKVFFVELFRPKAGEVQARRVGYKSDLRTNGRTFVNPFHATLPFFRKSIKIVSEADLSASLHAFPHVATWEDEDCPGWPELNITCKEGYDIKRNKCTRCKGTGKLKHYSSTTQDAISVKLPKPGDINPTIVTPQNVIDFKSPDVGILNWQDAKVDKLKAEAISTMYGNEVLAKTSIAETATAAANRRDEVYNTLHPAANNVSGSWKFFVRIISALLDNPKPKLLYEFPSDYKIQSIQEMLADLDLANKSQGPASLKQAIALDIAAKVYVDDDYAFLKEKVKAKFTPMQGRSEDTVLMLISLGKLTDEEEILWIHSDSIFDDLENTIPNFFHFTYEKQWPEIEKQIVKIQQKLAVKNQVLLSPFAAPTSNFKKGDRVEVIPGKEHVMNGMKMGGKGTVSIVDGNAYGIALDSMPNEVHKWYVAEELEPITSTKMQMA